MFKSNLHMANTCLALMRRRASVCLPDFLRFLLIFHLLIMLFRNICFILEPRKRWSVRWKGAFPTCTCACFRCSIVLGSRLFKCFYLTPNRHHFAISPKPVAQSCTSSAKGLTIEAAVLKRFFGALPDAALLSRLFSRTSAAIPHAIPRVAPDASSVLGLMALSRSAGERPVCTSSSFPVFA